MKILVALSCVPDTTSKINFSSDYRALDKSGINFIINPYDELCLTKAMCLKAKNQAIVTIVCVGDIVVEPIIRKTFAIGIDNAIRIDSEPLDSLSVAKEIAQVANEENYDLLLFGKESIDYNGGIVPSMVACILNLPFLNNCIDLELKGNELQLTREINGEKEFLIANYPIVISGQKGLVKESEIKIPNMREIMLARKKSLRIKSSQFKDERIKINNFEKRDLRKKVKFFDSNSIPDLIRLLRKKTKIEF